MFCQSCGTELAEAQVACPKCGAHAKSGLEKQIPVPAVQPGASGFSIAAIDATLPAMVRNELARLAPNQQLAFLEEYRRKSKSSGVGYLAWILFGWQYAYVRKWGVQVLFWITGGGFLLWWLVDAFRIPSLIRDYNKDVAVEALVNLKSISST